MNNDTLFCTACDSPVSLEIRYSGYVGACECNSFSMNPGGTENPSTWVRWETTDSPANFVVHPSGVIYNGEEIERRKVTCVRCSDDDNVSVEIETITIEGEEYKKASFTCSADHYIHDREMTSVAYYTQPYSMQYQVLEEL